MRITERIGRQQGYVENRYGQRVPVDADFAYRGVNYIIQPTAARLMKRAMHKCHEYLKKHRVGNILLQIHDELVFELSLECDHEHHARELKLLMEDNDEMFPYVETLVDMDVCRKNWLDRKKIEL
jgi:DNA polymerase I-like protein with 3'-5' exonuclease and polymerase domains